MMIHFSIHMLEFLKWSTVLISFDNFLSEFSVDLTLERWLEFSVIMFKIFLAEIYIFWYSCISLLIVMIDVKAMSFIWVIWWSIIETLWCISMIKSDWASTCINNITTDSSDDVSFLCFVKQLSELSIAFDVTLVLNDVLMISITLIVHIKCKHDQLHLERDVSLIILSWSIHRLLKSSVVTDHFLHLKCVFDSKCMFFKLQI